MPIVYDLETDIRFLQGFAVGQTIGFYRELAQLKTLKLGKKVPVYYPNEVIIKLLFEDKIPPITLAKSLKIQLKRVQKLAETQ